MIRKCSIQNLAHIVTRPLKIALKSFAIFTGEHLCWSLFFDKLTLLKNQLYLRIGFNTGVFL